MRWIVLALLIANAGLFAWFASERPGAPPVEAPELGLAEEAAGERVKLLREVDPDELSRRPAPAQEPEAVEPEAPAAGTEPAGGEPLCTLVGPFEESYQGEDLVQRLQALEVQAELRDVEMEGQMRYWVFLDPLGSRREAFNRLRELQSAGVDSYVIPKGSLTNGISFGIFSELDRAQTLADELRGRGIDARMREEPQMYLEQWVVLPPGAGETLADDFWVQLQLDYPGLDRRRNLCSELEGD
ncbi:SPOR domain-containing protein [Microbulbifer yueqingensis]|uniref:Sporulation related domain-containing protein n=1 Tax=Microbulbifer yueqingensis TaxID=658219 RepID=A0A1G9F1Q9_9GAMM|nr:hypothetical protein [Microbulbifer yueqingensis]SDK82377.1 hypothetical protein SAMN05216212_0021 [Microbulbifer yueqingensis]